jgi:hypothetical protein
VPFVLGAALTVLQTVTQSNSLALLFPWRISSVLTPIAVTVILTRLVALPSLPLNNIGIRMASIGILVCLAATGVWISVARLAFRSPDEELPVMAFVSESKAKGDVYFIPVPDPDKRSNSRGSLSGDFIPPMEKTQDSRLVPVGLQRFRLHTGAPLFVDFKSIPYKDVDVIEWLERVRFAKKVWDDIEAGNLAQAAAELRGRGVTHVVRPRGARLEGNWATMVYEDGDYRIYRLRDSRNK